MAVQITIIPISHLVPDPVFKVSLAFYSVVDSDCDLKWLVTAALDVTPKEDRWQMTDALKA